MTKRTDFNVTVTYLLLFTDGWECDLINIGNANQLLRTNVRSHIFVYTKEWKC